jgi:Flp pilus assembly pilin Flp
MMKNKAGWSAVEYSMLIAMVVAALLAMFQYLSFSVRGKLRQAADVFGQGEQFEPGDTDVY